MITFQDETLFMSVKSFRFCTALFEAISEANGDSGFCPKQCYRSSAITSQGVYAERAKKKDFEITDSLD